MQDLTTKALILVAGTALGALATYFVQEARYKKILDKEIDSIRAAYAKQDTKEPEVVFVESPPSDNPVPMVRTTPVIKAVRKEFDQIADENGYVNYGRLSKMDLGNVFDPELVETWRKAMEPQDEVPYVIPAESYSDEYLTYDKLELTYFAKDQVFVDSMEEVVEPYPTWLPSNFDDLFGCESGDVDLLYVRNDKQQTDIEVKRLWLTSSEVLEGLENDSD